MSVLFSKLTTRARMTVPKEVRQALGVKPGDMLVYRISKGTVTIARVEPVDRTYLNAVESTLSEWTTADDAAAYDDL